METFHKWLPCSRRPVMRNVIRLGALDANTTRGDDAFRTDTLLDDHSPVGLNSLRQSEPDHDIGSRLMWRAIANRTPCWHRCHRASRYVLH